TLVIWQLLIGNDLHISLAGAVVELEEAEASLGIAPRADPALELDAFADRFDLAGCGHGQFFHDHPFRSSSAKRSRSDKDNPGRTDPPSRISFWVSTASGLSGFV